MICNIVEKFTVFIHQSKWNYVAGKQQHITQGLQRIYFKKFLVLREFQMKVRCVLNGHIYTPNSFKYLSICSCTFFNSSSKVSTYLGILRLKSFSFISSKVAT